MIAKLKSQVQVDPRPPPTRPMIFPTQHNPRPGLKGPGAGIVCALARACLVSVGLCSSRMEVCHNGLDLRSSRMHRGSELNDFCQRMRAVKAACLVIAAAV